MTQFLFKHQHALIYFLQWHSKNSQNVGVATEDVDNDRAKI